MSQIIHCETRFLRHMAYDNPRKLIVAAKPSASTEFDLMTYWNPDIGEFMRVFSHNGYAGKPFVDLTIGRMSKRRIGFKDIDAAKAFVLARVREESQATSFNSEARY